MISLQNVKLQRKQKTKLLITSHEWLPVFPFTLFLETFPHWYIIPTFGGAE